MKKAERIALDTGATATSSMTHIAIQEALNGKVVEWMEKVSDEQYLAALGGRINE
jgi:hypothetical protein